MSILKEEDGRKWINFLLILFVLILGFVSYQLFLQLAEWFDLEARVSNFNLIAQACSVAVSGGSLLLVVKNNRAMTYLSDVFNELLKVVWPDRESTIKLTIGIVIALIVAGIFFGLIDLFLGKILGLLYK